MSALRLRNRAQKFAPRLRRAVWAWSGYVPLLLLAVVLLRMAAYLPGVETPHAHGGLVHTHASGAFSHVHDVAEASDETVYPVRIAVRQRPSDEELFNSHGAGHAQCGEESTSHAGDDAPFNREGSDHRKFPDSYFSVAHALVLTSGELELPIPPIPPSGVVTQCTPVKQRAIWSTKCTRGPPLALFVEIAFT